MRLLQSAHERNVAAIGARVEAGGKAMRRWHGDGRHGYPARALEEDERTATKSRYFGV